MIMMFLSWSKHLYMSNNILVKYHIDLLKSNIYVITSYIDLLGMQ